MKQQITEWIDALHSDNKTAYEALKKLLEQSENSDEVYAYFEQFAEMLNESNSFVRNRALALIGANAKWDRDNKADEIIDSYVKHLMDEKPITARQCAKWLPELAKQKPDLKETILEALRKADVTIYKESMQPLVQKDITDAIKEIMS